jgi:hypothetical protein
MIAMSGNNLYLSLFSRYCLEIHKIYLEIVRDLRQKMIAMSGNNLSLSSLNEFLDRFFDSLLWFNDS